MAHGQQQILDSIAATLVAQVPAVSGRVFVDRTDSLQPDELPAILVDESTDGEQVSASTLGGIYERQLPLRITAVVADGTAAVAEAREIGLAIEKALATDVTLGGLCSGGISLQGSRPGVSSESDRLMAVREQDWSATWYAEYSTPDLPI